MKKADLEKYSELHEEFIRECDRVVGIIKDMPEYQDDIEFADRFVLEDDDVFWEGDEYWNYGGHEYHSGTFPGKDNVFIKIAFSDAYNNSEVLQWVGMIIEEFEIDRSKVKVTYNLIS